MENKVVGSLKLNRDAVDIVFQLLPERPTKVKP